MEGVNFRKIAEELNISHMTLYRVINNAQDVKESTRARVIDALNRHGYYRNERSKPKTVIIDVDRSGRSDYMRSLVETLTERLSVHAFQCIETNHAENRRQFLLACRNADVAVLAPMRDRTVYDEAKDINPDLFILNLQGDTVGDVAIASNDFLGGELAARHLHSFGHDRHVAVMLPETQEQRHSFRNRYKGFLSEMLLLSPKCRIDILKYPLLGSLRRNKTLDTFFCRKKRPGALFCPGRFFADRVVEYCRCHGISIPGELSLLGYDKRPFNQPELPDYDRVVFDPEQLVNWAEYFIMNRPVMKCRSPVHLLLDMKIEFHQTVISTGEKRK